jgi:hypothetical protein
MIQNVFSFRAVMRNKMTLSKQLLIVAKVRQTLQVIKLKDEN